VSKTHIPGELRRQIREDAGHRYTGEAVSLFNPRIQVWGEHFAWSKDGIRIVGRTACGRATVETLRLNRELAVLARRRWVSVGWHPPND